MYSGIVTRKRDIKRLGIHQRFNMAAYRMIETYIRPEDFPDLRGILHFEGLNGPDGLKIKSPSKVEASHIYDPIKGDGDVPRRIAAHYNDLVCALSLGDHVRAAFDASWLAHYITDGLTPAHHYPLDKLKAELFGEDSSHGLLRRHWHWFGRKGAISTHLNFEMGAAAALLLFPLRAHLDPDKLAQARRLGPLAFFQEEARTIAQLKLYENFCVTGWTAEMARTVRRTVAPQAVHAIGIIWLLAYLEASQEALVAEPALAGI